MPHLIAVVFCSYIDPRKEFKVELNVMPLFIVFVIVSVSIREVKPHSVLDKLLQYISVSSVFKEIRLEFFQNLHHYSSVKL